MKRNAFMIAGLVLTIALVGSANAAVTFDSMTNDVLDSSVTVTASTTYPNSAFSADYLVDGDESTWWFCSDADYSDDGACAVSFSFDSAMDIDSIRLFDQSTHTSRTARNVAVYYSTTATTSTDTADYTLLGTYTPDVVSNNYTGETDYTGIYYTDLEDLNIEGAMSILLVFSNTYGAGPGFAEIQAAGSVSVPEPCTMGLLLASGAALAIRRRRR